ncbi:R3H domain-containing nucleic acid-binding protein [Leifsonia sp. F6_8S_P_1B]|uniref:R3H domain-containing nucleic acid-binding protein n=1 Tax=Leifsonia williamsii TaxID=3035919 RepID=A0ABT8K915_9MICO|nr:R3H domain-containing nucleic acid-binding protein [Leifsonia williamsii]MDN4613483.1 R3H domain-containing nucleic acid-binding protein [Leifsonia williamsii]
MTDVQTEFTSPSPADESAASGVAGVADFADGESASAESVSSDSPSVADLDREGDVAADYIEELLDIADIDGDIDIDTRNGRAYISVNAEQGTNLHLLTKPDTVAALQELTRLAVQNSTGEFSRLILDIAGSRDARQAELGTLVEHAISKLEGGAAEAALPPMSSYERKLVHDIVSERGFVSTSRGEGRDRYTVISGA